MTNEEIVERVGIIIAECFLKKGSTWGDLKQEILITLDQACEARVREGKIGLLNELKLGFATRGVDKGKDTILWDATQLCKLIDEIALTLTPTTSSQE